MTDKIIVLTTSDNEQEACNLARTLVSQHLAACVNVIPRIHSYYRWQGKLEEAEEWLLLIKTSRERFPQLKAAIEQAHSYEVPEVVALPIVDGAANYLNWLETSLSDEQ